MEDFGPPYTDIILSELLSAFGSPSERSAENEVAADNDSSSFLPLSDEILERREHALSRDASEPPRHSTPVKFGQDARPTRCRSIYGLYFEGNEEISLEYLGPTFRGDYDSESDSLESTDDSLEKESRAERSVCLDDEEVYADTRQLELEPQHDKAIETNPSPENVEICSDSSNALRNEDSTDRKSSAVRNEDSTDGVPSHVLNALLVAGASEHIAAEEKCAGERSTEATSSATRRKAYSFILVVNGQDDVPSVRSAIASLFPKARNASVEETGAEKPKVSVYEFEYEVVSADELEAASATEKKSPDEETRNSRPGNETFVDVPPTHARESVLTAGCRAHYDGEEYRAACSTEALFPASVNALHRSTGALDNENNYLDGVRFPGAPSPALEVCDSSLEPPRSYFDGECITVASSPDVHDSAPEPSLESDLNLSAYEPQNEKLGENATECIQILDNTPEKGETLDVVVAADNCRQESLSRTAEPVIIASDHEDGHTGTPSSERIRPATVTDSNCSAVCSGDRDDEDGAGSAVTSLPRIRYGYAERFPEIDSLFSTIQLELEPNIEKVCGANSATELGFRDDQAPNAAIEDRNQSSQKSLHIQAAQSHNDEEKKYKETSSTVTVSPAPEISSECWARGLESEEDYNGTGCIVGSLPGAHDSRIEFARRADSNCADNPAEYDLEIQEAAEHALVAEDESQDYCTLSSAIQTLSSPQRRPEYQPVAGARIGAEPSKDDVSHDTMPVMVDDTESSEAKSICENPPTSVLGFSVSTAHDVCSEIFREVDLMSSADGAAYNQQNKEKHEVILIAEDTSQDEDPLSTAMTKQSVLSPKRNPESLLVACTEARRDAFEDVSCDTLATTIGDTEFSGARSACQNDLSSTLLSSLSEAGDTCAQNFHEVSSRSSDDQAQYDAHLQEADHFFMVAEDTSQNDDTLSTEIRKQSILPPQFIPESHLVACTQVQRDVSEDDVSHDTMAVTSNDAEFSEARTTLYSAMPSLSEVDSADQLIRETGNVVLLTKDGYQDNDTLSSAIGNGNIPLPKGNQESLLPCTQILDAFEDDLSHGVMPFKAADTDTSGANITLENKLSSSPPYLVSGARDSSDEICGGVYSHSSADQAQYDPQIKEAGEVALLTEGTSQEDDKQSIAIGNQNKLALYNPESLLVCTQVRRDVSEDGVSHDTVPVTSKDNEFIGTESTHENDLRSALPSVSGVDLNLSADRGIEEVSQVLATEETPQDNTTPSSVVRNQDTPSPKNNAESPLTHTHTPLEVSEAVVSRDTTPVVADDTGYCGGSSTLGNNLSAALPSSLTVCDSYVELFNGVNSNSSANLAEYDLHTKEVDEVVLVTEDNSQDNGTLGTATRNQNVSSPKHNTESLLVACTEAQRDVSEDDISRETMPAPVGVTEISTSKSISQNNPRSDLPFPEDRRDASKLYEDDSSRTLLRESLPPNIKATPQHSKSEPAAWAPKPVKQLVTDVLEWINTTSFLPIVDYCPPSHSGSVTSRSPSRPLLTLLSEGEIRSDSESENVLSLDLLPKAAACEGVYADPEYDPEAFLPISPISAPTMSEGETADSASDESNTSSFLASELNEAEKCESEDTSTGSESTTTDTNDETTSSCSSSSSTQSYSSSSSTQSASDSEDSTASTSSPLSGLPRHEIPEAQTSKEADISKENTVRTEDAAAAMHSEPGYAQPVSSRTDLFDHQDNQENYNATSLASTPALKMDNKDDLQYDADILIPLLLPVSLTSPSSRHAEPCYTQPACSAADLPDRQDNQENGFSASSTLVAPLKEYKKRDFEYDADMVIPLALPISLTRPSQNDTVESRLDHTAPPAAPPFAKSNISGGKKTVSEHASLTLPRLSPCPERLSGDGKAANVQDELPHVPTIEKERKQKGQRKRPLQNDLRRRSKRRTIAAIKKPVRPETTAPPRPNKRPPLISDDPAENRDNNNPQWESVRRLRSKDERYRAVLRVWHSKRIPDPQKDLTVFHYRPRLLGLKLCVLPSSRRQRKRKASCSSGSRSGDAKRQRLDTDIFDKKIEDVKKSRDREMAEAEDKLNRCLREVRKHKRSDRRRRSAGDHSGSSPTRPGRYRRQSSGVRSDSSPKRRSRRRRSSSESYSSCSARRRRSRSRCSSEDENDSSPGRSGRRRHHPFEDTSDYFPRRCRRGRCQTSGGRSDSPSERHRTRWRRSSEDGTDGSRKEVFRRRFRSISRSRGRRHTSEDDSDSSPRRRRRGWRDSPGSPSDSSPRRRFRGRRWSSESQSDDDSCTRSRVNRQRRLSHSDNDRSPSRRSRDRTKSENSLYWRRRERRIREDFEADVQGITSRYHTRVDKLVAARKEVRRVNSFYSGLRNTDPRMLSARQTKDHWKLESMLREMKGSYEEVQD
nr:serine-rich adhesin for platelets-like [Dermacentor andersoni]